MGALFKIALKQAYSYYPIDKTYIKSAQRNLENFFKIMSKDIWLQSTIYFKIWAFFSNSSAVFGVLTIHIFSSFHLSPSHFFKIFMRILALVNSKFSLAAVSITSESYWGWHLFLIISFDYLNDFEFLSLWVNRIESWLFR